MADDTTEDQQDPAKADPSATDEQLGENGKKALEAERTARRELERKLKELEPQAAKARELEEAQKTEAEKLTERSTAAETRATTAELTAMRYEVALDKGLTKAQAFRLVGNTLEELAADADVLITESGGPKPPASRKPNERLRGGSDPDAEPEEDDPRKLAASIAPRRL